LEIVNKKKGQKMPTYGLNTGARQVTSDINPTVLRVGATTSQTVDLQRKQWYKLLNSVLVIKGQLQATCESSVTESAEKVVSIPYKSDHLYNIINNLVIRLNNAYEVKNYTRLAFLRFINLLQDEGYADFAVIPRSITIKQGETSGVADFKLMIPISFLMYDMTGKTRSFLATWLYNALNMTWQTGPIDNIIKEQPTNAKIDYVKDSVTLESSSEYWITGQGVFSGANTSEVLNKMGVIYRVTSFERDLGLGSNNVVIDDFTPTTNTILSNFWIITRDPATGQRIDGVIKRFKFADGDKPLFDCTPDILRQLLKSKYNFSTALFTKNDSNEADGQGALYGVHKIDTSCFGDIDNAVLAVGNWRQPKLYLDIASECAELSEKSKRQVKFEIYQTFAEVPQIIQNLATQYVQSTQGA